VTSECWAVLDTNATMLWHARQVQEHCEAGGPFDEGADCGAVETEDKVALPVTWYSAVSGFGWSLTDEDLIGDGALTSYASARPRDTERTPGAEASSEFTPQSSSTLDEQRLVDRLMRDPHRRIIGEIEVEPVGNLLRAPRHRPAPVLASPVTPADPAHIGTCQERPVEFGDSARQSILYVLAERIIDGKLRHFGTPSPPIGMSLGGQGAVVEIAAAGRGIPAQFPRDGRRRALQAPRSRVRHCRWRVTARCPLARGTTDTGPTAGPD
jgi:hypothetical protein